ncbi:ammonium transporter [Persephonella hydrogeniphila]|uniref:Ammonium transporter n=1 Tax=Persephonella hydrogeniphila TaxID=198703 RepID=A0A285NPU7_9AQUI|nr:ammonium transporter [Persephonella hydrogeniphila]SNZ09651.1 ammonium transporter [Persephonella hydrogeniphila]
MSINPADNVWILISTALVLLMSIPGLAVFYGGLTRTRSVLNTIMMVFSAFGLVSLIWILYGYSLSFGSDIGGVIGNLQYFLLSGIKLTDPAPSSDNLYHYLFIFFQMTFAAITVALMAGAFIERMKFSAWLIITVLWGTFVYFPVAHWIWGGGWLSNLGTLDFAGGLVVHETSGLGALVGAILLGKRKEPIMLPANLSLVAIGTGLLWFGWFGFNGGSALAINQVAVSAAFVTTIAAFIGGLTWMFAEWILFKKPTSLGMFTGIIAGLATITPAAGFVDVGAAIIIGLLAGIVCFIAVVYIKNRFGYDDSLDVFGVHGVGGMLGAFLLAIFAKPEIGDVAGILYGNFSQVIPQIVGILAVGIYTIVLTFIIFKLVDGITGLRVAQDEEIEGLDERTHGERLMNEPIKY